MRTIANFNRQTNLIVSLMILWAPSAFAQVGGSNLGPAGYPSPTCPAKPSKPAPPLGHDRQALDLYNSRVEEFNSAEDRYVSCLRDYLDKAKNDMDLIKQKTDQVVDEANRPS